MQRSLLGTRLVVEPPAAGAPVDDVERRALELLRGLGYHVIPPPAAGGALH